MIQGGVTMESREVPTNTNEKETKLASITIDQQTFFLYFDPASLRLLSVIDSSENESLRKLAASLAETLNTLHPNAQPKSSQYYVKTIVPSGKNNNDSYEYTAVVIDSDEKIGLALKLTLNSTKHAEVHVETCGSNAQNRLPSPFEALKGVDTSTPSHRQAEEIKQAFINNFLAGKIKVETSSLPLPTLAKPNTDLALEDINTLASNINFAVLADPLKKHKAALQASIKRVVTSLGNGDNKIPLLEAFNRKLNKYNKKLNLRLDSLNDKEQELDSIPQLTKLNGAYKLYQTTQASLHYINDLLTWALYETARIYFDDIQSDTSENRKAKLDVFNEIFKPYADVTQGKLSYHTEVAHDRETVLAKIVDLFDKATAVTTVNLLITSYTAVTYDIRPAIKKAFDQAARLAKQAIHPITEEELDLGISTDGSRLVLSSRPYQALIETDNAALEEFKAIANEQYINLSKAIAEDKIECDQLTNNSEQCCNDIESWLLTQKRLAMLKEQISSFYEAIPKLDSDIDALKETYAALPALETTTKTEARDAYDEGKFADFKAELAGFIENFPHQQSIETMEALLKRAQQDNKERLARKNHLQDLIAKRKAKLAEQAYRKITIELNECVEAMRQAYEARLQHCKERVNALPEGNALKKFFSPKQVEKENDLKKNWPALSGFETYLSTFSIEPGKVITEKDVQSRRETLKELKEKHDKIGEELSRFEKQLDDYKKTSEKQKQVHAESKSNSTPNSPVFAREPIKLSAPNVIAFTFEPKARPSSPMVIEPVTTPITPKRKTGMSNATKWMWTGIAVGVFCFLIGAVILGYLGYQYGRGLDEEEERKEKLRAMLGTESEQATPPSAQEETVRFNTVSIEQGLQQQPPKKPSKHSGLSQSCPMDKTKTSVAGQKKPGKVALFDAPWGREKERNNTSFLDGYTAPNNSPTRS
jgi:hypothetical protein